MSYSWSRREQDNDSFSHLLFLSDRSNQRVIFTSNNWADFFTSPAMSDPLFITGGGDSNIVNGVASWQECLTVKQDERVYFKTHCENDPSIPILISASGLLYGENQQPGILFVMIKGFDPDQLIQLIEKFYPDHIELALHDLQAPLRKIRLLGERLAVNYVVNQSQDDNEFIKRIDVTVHDMTALKNGFSLLAKVHEGNGKITLVDTNALVHEVVAEFAGTLIIPEVATHLPRIEGDQEQLRVLFSILLKNAMLFREKDGQPEVSVRSERLADDEKAGFGLHEHANYHKFTVSDNGIGFDPSDAKIIFEPLTRLNGKSAFPGTGLGLAVGKAIVNNHRGVVYAFSNPHGGSSFIIILPEKQ